MALPPEDGILHASRHSTYRLDFARIGDDETPRAAPLAEEVTE
jgi:hypothetical protein